jgi:hypothetical protein
MGCKSKATASILCVQNGDRPRGQSLLLMFCSACSSPTDPPLDSKFITTISITSWRHESETLFFCKLLQQ